VSPKLPLFTPCPHTRTPLAGGVCAECWEERASALYREYLEVKKVNDSISVCAKHLPEIKKGGCVVCRNEEWREVHTYLTTVVTRAAQALEAQTNGDPRADRLLEAGLQGILKAGEFLEERKKKPRRA
jgi:hypothetical protein